LVGLGEGEGDVFGDGVGLATLLERGALDVVPVGAITAAGPTLAK